MRSSLDLARSWGASPLSARLQVCLCVFAGLCAAGCKVYQQELIAAQQAPTSVTTSTPSETNGDRTDTESGRPLDSIDPAKCIEGECWWTGPETNTCKSTGLPTPADRPEKSDDATMIDAIYVALTEVRMGSTNRAGERTPDAWADFGFDLDGLCTNSSTCPGREEIGCRRAGPAVPFDGQLCRDNTFARLQPVLATVPELGNEFGLNQEVFNCALWRGSYNTLIRISEYNGQANDAHVRVDFYASPGIQDALSWTCPADDFREAYPPWRSSRKWGIDQSWLSGSIGAPGTLPDSRYADADAYVRGGYLVAQVPEGSPQGFLGDGAPYRGFMYKVRRGSFVARLAQGQDNTWSLDDGLMAGRILKEDLLQGFREAGFCGSGGLETFYSNMLTYIDEDADVLASGKVDPNADCDAMSYAIGFKARQATPGSAVEVAPRIECCPPHKTTEECSAVCGDGKRSGAENCDTAIEAGQPGACPTACESESPCMARVLQGTGCETECAAQPIRTIGPKDGCCPPEASTITDVDCTATCGNGVVELGETCDPGNSCLACPERSGCLLARTVGSADDCNLRCELTSITECMAGDDCCPARCNNGSDTDCSATCGNGTLEPGETCETNGPQEMRCLANCDDGQACTLDESQGSSENCNLTCTHTPIARPVNGDGCCPAGATANSDDDCSSNCGNRVVEADEECDDGNDVEGDGCSECRNEDRQEVCQVRLGFDDACAECACSKCQTAALDCYSRNDTEEVELCHNMMRCHRETNCGNPDCFCGTFSLLSCVAGASDGPCKQQVIDAAGTNSLAEIGERADSLDYPIGRANALDACLDMNCQAECAL